ncbi:MAG: cache domain-containing protein [Candidatus Omnitrophica bacterium]|nr:cache domain-containing protein [Candidatus Omnitrophota bacterium]MDD5670553.1 cache domain-containing protein [Candidatus Omnitrophota bacterium]
MKKVNLRTEILVLFLIVIILLSVLTTAFGYYIVKKYIVGKAQDQVISDLKTTRMIYQKQVEKMQLAFALATPDLDLETFKKITGLDYLYLVDRPEQARSEIVQSAFREGAVAGGRRIIRKEELLGMGRDLYAKAVIEIKSTPKARPSDKKLLEDAMSVEIAQPFVDETGKVFKVLYGGQIRNRNFQIIDEMSEAVFENRLYGAKPLGTVTLFLDDVRIATNVLDKDGQRAIGTRVSEIVYDKVVRHGGQWFDRAFVVTDWYLTAYEPIKDIQGNIIGILYVGILEKPYLDLERNLLVVFLLIVSVVAAMALLLAVVFASKISMPVTEMRDATARISAGDLQYRLKSNIPVKELSQLAASFNVMAERLDERERRIKIANEKLEALNKNYFDMIGFVSHELKGLLGSIIMNVYSVKDGYLGELNENQQRAINSAAHSLDHFESMVKNYLDLSRIEKGELQVSKTTIRLNEDVIGPNIGHFEKERQRKNMKIQNAVPAGVAVSADKNLLMIVCNNLLGNAIKYGSEGGQIVIQAKNSNEFLEIRFYNDGTPIAENQKDHLFKRFSRLPGSEKIKGTGLGLFIVKEIVEKHGGKVWVETKATGNEFVFTIAKS